MSWYESLLYWENDNLESSPLPGKEGFIWITTSREQLWTFYRVKWNFGRTGRFVGASSYYGLKMARTWLIVRIIDVKTDSISVFFVLFTLRLLVSVKSEISETRRRRVHCMQRIEQCVSVSQTSPISASSLTVLG